MSDSDCKLLRVGELAKAAGKTVRALHLYEELGLLEPAARSEGGFRLYRPEAKARIAWVSKLQAIGFKLSEIQEFVRGFEEAPSAREATDRARQVFADKLADIREQIARLQSIESDIVASLGYLDACQDCSPEYSPRECHLCTHQGHERGSAPLLFANLTCTAEGPCLPHGDVARDADGEDYDVALSDLQRGEGEGAEAGGSGSREEGSIDGAR
ncbi:MerR family transcriptional regulator [Haliangium ochraceum]|uniref:Transcriptional regulator, MerR family n=1 Tax=Haliangium ochraceum (strain DSM 14365 / JCM 11303 / SMP-2) TaxID=502025 RepID=D0LH12_HALO1|nr:MerR family transcriptional regulator [Haliangium ochraceum]ACY14734.1 transcriptional regulator, MerR family [Haliangium ochraceum DSM 14365]